MNLSLIFIFCAVASVEAARVNPGFETGTLDGWTVVAANADLPPLVVNSVSTDGSTFYDPAYGNYFAVVVGSSETSYIEQTFSGTKGEIISGKAAFLPRDFLPYDDYGTIQVLEGATVLFTASISSTDGQNTPWTPFSYVLPKDGTFTMRASSTNLVDNFVDSLLLVDTAETCTTELMSWNLWDGDADKVVQILDGQDVCTPTTKLILRHTMANARTPRARTPRTRLTRWC